MEKKLYQKSLEILSDFLECDFDLSNFSFISRQLKKIILRQKIKILKTDYHLFKKNNGVTLIFILSNSHLALHTWPEKRLVNLDLFICNFTRNYEKQINNIYREVKNLLKPKKTILKKIIRIT